MNLLLAGAAVLALTGCGSTTEPTARDTMAPEDAAAEPMAEASMAHPMVGGAEMFPNKPIAANASAAPNLTTLVSALKQAGLVDTLSGPGPFTVFAPTNEAFGKVDQAALDGLMKPGMKDSLKKVLTYHVVSGKMTAADLMAKIKAGGGKAMLSTVEGEPLTLTMDGSNVKIAGMGGSMAMVSQADVMQSNGVVHVVDGVLMPKM
ncbi:fasciclin domain-containing protein [Novosphingobium sp. PS1R-30]|uniref:Fasciclin domain-containing protein n=2 Tax=Novosphingobium anseongense TaxID=3133436 RepID=A0ABU8S2V5_9SPHN